MSAVPTRVVLDTVVFIQSIISGRGPSAECIKELRAGRFILLMSDETFAELRDVPVRPRLLAKYPFVTKETVDSFVAEVELLAVQIHQPPTAIVLPRDANDEPFINLAAAGDAQFIVTWNKRHLTYLMRQDTPEGKEFCSRFPGTRIISPPDFLAAIRRPS